MHLSKIQTIFRLVLQEISHVPVLPAHNMTFDPEEDLL